MEAKFISLMIQLPLYNQILLTNIKAKKMHYDAVTKKLELMDKVLAVYE